MNATDSRDNRVGFRLNPAVEEWLESRRARMYSPSRSIQAHTELGLWRTVLAEELKRIRLTLGEAQCLASISGGPMLQPTVGHRLGLLFAEAYDAFRLANEGAEESSYGAHFGIDEKKLLDWLAGLSPAADLALRDALSRWWETRIDDDAERFRAVGINVIDPKESTPR